MSGHSKWSTIKRQKAVTDSRRSAAFTKLARLISVAARAGGGDPNMNFQLRLAIDKARAANVPNDNIERAIQAGTGEGKEGQTKEVAYEGFGPGGVAVIVNAVTDNPNRTAAEIRTTFTKHHGTMGGQNSVAWMFELRGVISIPSEALRATDRQAVELAAIDAGASDVREEGDGVLVECPPDRLTGLRAALDRLTGTKLAADVELVAQNTVSIDEPTAQQLHELCDTLTDLPDVISLATNEA
ncbi:MAG: YebC/PmpR family DNA-binding transcriptional regulator [Candidatus Kerfeldbacteria bacterium]|nr:YebC/PmpR family DNA-binding transcriptional regulator [Candidatus Kerfeldbacteria bacterium]